MMVTRKTIRASDHEIWTVTFDEDNVTCVERTEVVWSLNHPSANTMMNERIKRIVKLAWRSNG